jgi:hypothetical protein
MVTRKKKGATTFQYEQRGAQVIEIILRLITTNDCFDRCLGLNHGAIVLFDQVPDKTSPRNFSYSLRFRKNDPWDNQSQLGWMILTKFRHVKGSFPGEEFSVEYTISPEGNVSGGGTGARGSKWFLRVLGRTGINLDHINKSVRWQSGGGSLMDSI